jgi:hypothetical protein
MPAVDIEFLPLTGPHFLPAEKYRVTMPALPLLIMVSV